MAKKSVAPKKKKVNMSAKIREAISQNSGLSGPQIAAKLKQYGVKEGLVYQVRRAMKNKSKVKKKSGKRRGRPVAASSVTNVDQVIAAANLIKSCGSTEQARQALKAAEKVAKALDR